MYPSEPEEEIAKLQKVINIIKNDSRNKTIITDYQFISVILSFYDNSPSQVWFVNHVVNQDKKSKFFKIYKEFSINKLKENKIEIVYIIKPLWGGNNVFENGLNKNCYTKKEITEVLDGYLLQSCKELSN